MSLTPELQTVNEEIKAHARSYGLDFFEVIFEFLDYDEMNEVAAYGGFPNRYPHWRFGMEYEELQKSYAYGLHKIYEMVINNDPSYAYLLKSNNLVDQKLVMCHVYAHVDFFKNNVWFAPTNRKMVDEMANHAARIRRYMDKHGVEVVEDFIDRCLSLENLIDYHSPFIQRRRPEPKSSFEEEASEPGIVKFKTEREYLDSFVNPPEFLEAQKKALEEEKQRKRKVPEEPQKDVMLFLLENAPLERWQQDVLAMLREEAYYLAPQGQTKIMNEGWASYWHSKMMTEKVLRDSEVIDYADHHSGTVRTSPGHLNPYKLGMELFRDIEDRWNKGRFGKEWEECDDWEAKQNWDKELGLGRQKIFEVRRLYSDVMFIDAFLTPEFCREQKLFTYEYNEKSDFYEIAERDFRAIKQKLLFALTNFGQPLIYVEDANYLNRGELYLLHRHEGIDLKVNEAKDTLANIYKIWGRPVHLETVIDETKTLLSFDGEEHSESEID